LVYTTELGKALFRSPRQNNIWKSYSNEWEISVIPDRSRCVRHCDAISNEAINTLRAVEETWTCVYDSRWPT